MGMGMGMGMGAGWGQLMRATTAALSTPGCSEEDPCSIPTTPSRRVRQIDRHRLVLLVLQLLQQQSLYIVLTVQGCSGLFYARGLVVRGSGNQRTNRGE